MLNIDALLAPIAAIDPCGEDLAFSPEVDEIARARLAESAAAYTAGDRARKRTGCSSASAARC